MLVIESRIEGARRTIHRTKPKSRVLQNTSWDAGSIGRQIASLSNTRGARPLQLLGTRIENTILSACIK